MKVLIVDDSAPIRRVLARILEDAGYDIIDAGDAEAAIDALRASPVDVVLTDVRMPGPSGVDLARQVAVEFPDIAIVAMSGLGDADLEQFRRELDIDVALTKPMSPEMLRKSLESAIKRKRRK